MSHLSEATLPLLERLYDAVAEDDAWPTFLDAVARQVGGTVPGLYLTDRVTDATLFGAVTGLDPAWGSAYEAYYRRHDLRRARIRALPAGSVFVGSALLDDRELVRSEF